MNAVTVDKALVKRVAGLANLQVSEKETGELVGQFQETLKVVDELFEVETAEVAPTYQVNNLQNVWREDVVNEEAQFTQEEALKNAQKTARGYFVVERIIDHEAE
jgi:aspartyl-tRNA(Asn)/glutamyl-tRNA(Gln) amidotransferase subunit C